MPLMAPAARCAFSVIAALTAQIAKRGSFSKTSRKRFCAGIAANVSPRDASSPPANILRSGQ